MQVFKAIKTTESGKWVWDSYDDAPEAGSPTPCLLETHEADGYLAQHKEEMEYSIQEKIHLVDVVVIERGELPSGAQLGVCSNMAAKCGCLDVSGLLRKLAEAVGE